MIKEELSTRELERIIFIIEMHQRGRWEKANQDIMEKLRRMMNAAFHFNYRNKRINDES